MFIVTNREVVENRTGIDAFLHYCNTNGPNELRLAEATRSGSKWKVNILPDRIPDTMAKEVGLVPDIDPVTKKPLPIFASRYAARKILARMNPAASGGRGKGKNLLFFVHGFNNDIKAVLDRAERFEKNYGVEVITFSWPADGGGAKGVLSYKSDKRDALASTGALDRCFGRLHEYLHEIHAEHVRKMEAEANKRFPEDAEKWDRFFTAQAERWCPFSVNLLLHSMGNYLYKHLLKSSVYRGNLLIFDNIVLAAADTNNKDHDDWVDRIPCRGRLFVTINEKDNALLASRMKMGEQQDARLGHYPYRLNSKRAMYVDFTNEAHVGDSHAYFEGGALKNKSVREFFEEALNGKSVEEKLRAHYDPARNIYRFR